MSELAARAPPAGRTPFVINWLILNHLKLELAICRLEIGGAVQFYVVQNWPIYNKCPSVNRFFNQI